MNVKPYWNCYIGHISQPFGVNPTSYQPNGHTGVDFVGSYGVFLVAPEDCYVEEIITDETFDLKYWENLEKGFGILLRSVANPSVKYLHWHCLQIFPVKKEQLVKRGEAVAQMGNSGFCMVGGKIVPINLRHIPPFRGTHTHYEKRVNGQYVNPVPDIDFGIPVTRTSKQWIQQTLLSMVNFLNTRI